MKTSERGISFLKGLEGFRADAYQDVAGVWTIGYGITKNVKPGDITTEEKADQALRLHVARVEEFLNRVIKVELNQGQFDALVSFVYNVGESAFNNSQTMQLINHKVDDVPTLFKRWRFVTVGGRKVESPGLLARRRKEGELWTSEPRPDPLCQSNKEKPS